MLICNNINIPKSYDVNWIIIINYQMKKREGKKAKSIVRKKEEDKDKVKILVRIHFVRDEPYDIYNLRNTSSI